MVKLTTPSRSDGMKLKERSRGSSSSIFSSCAIGGLVLLLFAREYFGLDCRVDQAGSSSTNDAHDDDKAKLMPVSTAYEQSYGLFDDITDLMWQRMRHKTQTTSWYRNPSNPLENVQDAEWWNANNMLPHFQCPHAERIGGANNKNLNSYEGTKLLCNPDRLVHPPEKSTCLIYSVGCAGDFKFEDAMYERHKGACEIHVFDPAAAWERPGDVQDKNIHYHAWGLRSSYDHESKSVVWPKGRGGGFKTFQDTLQELGHENRTIDIFKIDCEGCEWSSHKDWIGFGFRQILIEMHGVPRPDGDPSARWYQKPMDMAKDYYNDFAHHGYALYSRDPNGKLGLELSFLKLRPDFWMKPSTQVNHDAAAAPSS